MRPKKSTGRWRASRTDRQRQREVLEAVDPLHPDAHLPPAAGPRLRGAAGDHHDAGQAGEEDEVPGQVQQFHAERRPVRQHPLQPVGEAGAPRCHPGGRVRVAEPVTDLGDVLLDVPELPDDADADEQHRSAVDPGAHRPAVGVGEHADGRPHDERPQHEQGRARGVPARHRRHGHGHDGLRFPRSVRRLAGKPAPDLLPPCVSCGPYEPGKPLQGNGLYHKPDGERGDHRARDEGRHEPPTRTGQYPPEQRPAPGEQRLPARRRGERGEHEHGLVEH